MSTATKISFEGFSLQSSTYRTENINYRHFANKTIDEKPEPRRGGFDVIDTLFSQKEITITGWILSDTKQNLRIAIDDLKRNLLKEEGNLDIEYGDSILRYKATVSSINVNEEHHHITRIPYTINFLSQPWGTSTASTSDSKNITSSPYAGNINIIGSFGPFPTIRWTASGTPSTAITKIKFENTTTEDYIEIPNINLNSSGKYLEVNIDDMLCTENGTTNKDFLGVFPSFLPTTNSYSTTVSGSGYTLVQTITYYPTYL